MADFVPLRRLFCGFVRKRGNAVKQGLLKNSNLFESLNFRYFGPIDGHYNLPELVRVLDGLAVHRGTQAVACDDRKRKGP